VTQYQLMRRAQYEKIGNPLALTLDPKIPLQVYEARNAVDIAKAHGADKDAPDIFAKATGSLQMTEAELTRKGEWKAVIASARQTAQFAEDARALAAERQEAARIEKERQNAADTAKAQAEAKAAAEAAEAKRQADEQLAQQQAAAQQQADQQQAALDQAQREKAALRARLLEQFNRVLPTTDTPRGLVVNMGDVLFDTGKADLRPAAREALAKLSGIVLNYPSLRLSIEGYTDSTGSADFNQTLSEKRADGVLNYLNSQGVDSSSLSARGFGAANPVADNSTADGRQKNRRVEIVVSGEVIGTKIGM
jgi:outer membrane protein OmpA-like peptidoglycan-associated protein